MRYFYIAVCVKQDRNESIFGERPSPEYNPGFYAYAFKCSPADNLKSALERIGGLQYANLCPTKKAACELVTAWNDGYKNNGTFLYDTPAF